MNKLGFEACGAIGVALPLNNPAPPAAVSLLSVVPNMVEVGCAEACDAPCVAEFDNDVNRLGLGASTEAPLLAPAGLKLPKEEFEVVGAAALSCDEFVEDGIVKAGWVVVDAFWRLANGLLGVDAGVVDAS